MTRLLCTTMAAMACCGADPADTAPASGRYIARHAYRQAGPAAGRIQCYGLAGPGFAWIEVIDIADAGSLVVAGVGMPDPSTSAVAWFPLDDDRRARAAVEFDESGYMVALRGTWQMELDRAAMEVSALQRSPSGELTGYVLECHDALGGGQ